MLVVIRVGGSVIASPVNSQLINQYVKLLKKLRSEGFKIVAVVGGGALAREFIKTGNQLGVSEGSQDWLAIHVSRLYALLFKLKLDENGSEGVSTSIEEAVDALNRGEIVVMGGLKPGMTTDTVAASVAQKAKAQVLVKATDQDGIYSSDPKKYKDAKKLDKITFHELAEILEQDRHKAGIHQVLDPVAVKILEKARIKTVVVNGYDPRNIQYAVQGKEVGTTIT